MTVWQSALLLEFLMLYFVGQDFVLQCDKSLKIIVLILWEFTHVYRVKKYEVMAV